MTGALSVEQLEDGPTILRDAVGRSVVHGVVYEFSATGFTWLGISEGVPGAYYWQPVTLTSYEGDTVSTALSMFGSTTNPAHNQHIL